MGAICGIVGRADQTVCDAMIRALSHRSPAMLRIDGPAYSVAASQPGSESLTLVDGRPCDSQGAPLAPGKIFETSSNPDAARAKLRGAFAIAVGFDNGLRWRLFRDRLGRKPLYYFHDRNVLLFASELKALLASGLVPRRLNLLGVDRYLTLRCVAGPESIVQHVYHVQPGHVVEFAGDQLRDVQFDSCDLRVQETTREAAVHHLSELLGNVSSRAEGDAVLWSSGIDCAALAAFKGAAQPVFVAIERSWQDETRLAKDSAQKMHLPLLVAPGRRFTEEAFTKAVAALDEPLADPTIFPLWLIAEGAAKTGNRFLSGHGADEMLGGYPRYHFLQKARGVRHLVPATLLSDLIPALPPNAFVRRGSRYLASIRDNQRAYLSLLSVFDDGERDELYTEVMKAALHELGPVKPEVSDHFTQDDLTRNILSLEVNVGLPKLLLPKCDRIAAAHGLTLELPYLDDLFVDWALRLPPPVKFGVRSKPLLRLATRGVLPAPIRLRTRRDFKVPHSGHVMQVIDSMTRQLVTPARVDASGLFKWHVVETILRSASHNVYRRRQFWALLLFFAWYRAVMEA